MLTNANTFVRSDEVKAIRSLSASQVKRRILQLAVQLYQVPGTYLHLGHDAGQVFTLGLVNQDVSNGYTARLLAQMPLRRMLVVLELRAAGKL